MNPNIHNLHPYPFEKLNKLKAGVTENDSLSHIALSIGEPKHAAPDFVLETLKKNLGSISQYPMTKGSDELRQCIAQWLTQRFQLGNCAPDPDRHVLPVNGTREALFAFAQAIIDPSKQPLVLAPNPFYQIYEGAAILAGSEIKYLNTTAENDYIPELDKIDEKTWQRCQLMYICSPGNPTGKVLDEKYLTQLIALADRYNFVLAADECYSEIYPDENNPPVGLLQVCAKLGRHDFKNCVVFHSLSKRSNLPGLRSGFVAGDADILKQFLRYRTYHGCAMSMPFQAASIAAWSDELHVKNNRELYRNKFTAVLDILTDVMDISAPDASFYLWPNTAMDDEVFARKLFAQENVTVLPGSYLSRPANNVNPGAKHVRLALVAELKDCIDAAQRIKRFIQSL